MRNIIMKRKLFIIHILSLICLIQLAGYSKICFAQSPPPSTQTGKPIERPSIKNGVNSRAYIEIDLRFSISLIEPTYSRDWLFKEGVVRISYAKPEITGGKQNLREFTKLNNDALLSKVQGKATNEKYYETGDAYSSVTNFKFDDGKSGLRKFFLTDEVLFILFAQYDNSTDTEYFAKAFETFKIVGEQEIRAELQRKFEEATPQALPQNPKLKDNHSDAKYENLKGKVMKIIEESENVSSDPTKVSRKPSQSLEYDKDGNLLKTVNYDYRGNPGSINVYGFIDGKRVSKYGFVKYPYNPPPPAPPPPLTNTPPEPKRDLRYSTAYEYKYVDGKLVETFTYANNEKLLYRKVLSYKENQIEALQLSSNGKAYRKAISKVDQNGFVIKESSFDIIDDNPKEDRSFTYSYEFDTKGNWIKKVRSKEVIENGMTILTPVYVYYRTISYY